MLDHRMWTSKLSRKYTKGHAHASEYLHKIKFKNQSIILRIKD